MSQSSQPPGFDTALQNELIRNSKGGASQSGGGGQGNPLAIDDQIALGGGLNKPSVGFDKPVTSFQDNGIIGAIDEGSLAKNAGMGDISFMKGMQQVNVSVPSGNTMTAPSLNQGSIIGVNAQGQGH